MPIPFQLTSPRFHNGEAIPVAYTCEGDDLPPPLHWEGEPPGTRSFALVMQDPAGNWVELTETRMVA